MSKAKDLLPPDYLADVMEFAEKFGLKYEGKPRNLPLDMAKFRIAFMREEIKEYESDSVGLEYTLGLKEPKNSQVIEHLENQLDALVDEVYVVLGTAIAQFPPGVFEEAWKRVHYANMQKIRVKSKSESNRGSSYDVTKPPGWQPPRHVDLVQDHAYEDIKKRG